MECWYEKRPVGHNTLASTYKRICDLAGLEGQYSNHSGRATAATTLLKAGIPDKMALQRTGHRTLESLREYQSLDTNDTKRVSDALSSTRADNAEICEKQQICVANSNNIEGISSDMLDECDVSDVELIQALESYETSVQAEGRSSSSANHDFNGFFSNCTIGTLNLYINNK